MFHWFKKHTKDGLERPDSTPLEISLREKPLTIREQLERFQTSNEISERLRSRGVDTFDEADDFDTGDLEPDEKNVPYESEFYGLQARLDEQRAGMVEEVPRERLDRANKRLESLKAKAKGGSPAQAAEPQKKD